MSEDIQETAAGSGLWRLKLMAFLSGAVLMSLEMSGVRILNVFFGSTIYVWGAIIGIFLGALSLGYYIGGIVADKRPELPVLGFILLITAFFIFLVPFIAEPLCSSLSGIEGMDPRIQALIGSIVLYFIPSVLLGMVSPFAVRLAAHEVQDIGRVAGRLYAISTLGSIAGTFLTAFLLVEIMGMRATIWALGIVLVLTAMLSFKSMKANAAALIIGAVIAYPSYLASSGNMVDFDFMTEVMEEFDSPYHHIVIAKGPALVDKTRPANYMMFNTQIQSGIVNDTENGKIESACGYIRMLHLGMLFRKNAPEKALVIGCGGGIGPMIFKQDYPELKTIDVVDIDSKVFDSAAKYFDFPRNDNVIKSHIMDGRRFVRNSEPGYYDYMVLDAYSSGGQVPFHLLTKEFFELTDRSLASDGTLVINLISAAEGERALLLSSVVKTLNDVYKKENGAEVYIFPRNSYAYHNRPMNIIIVCTKAGKRMTQLEIKNMLSEKLRNNFIKDRNLSDLVYNVMPEYKVAEEAVLITDDFAPLDSMVCR
ncbi:MAG: spermidine synthase [Planctomycetota bacterium]|jgi:spermidine synthase